MRDLITGVAIYRKDEWKIPFLKEEGGSTDGENGNGNNTNNRSGDKMNVDDGKNNEESKESGDDEGQTSDEDKTYEVNARNITTYQMERESTCKHLRKVKIYLD